MGIANISSQRWNKKDSQCNWKYFSEHFGIRPLSSIMEQYVGKQCWITVIKKAGSTLACYLCTLDFS